MSSNSELGQIENALVGAAERMAVARLRHRRGVVIVGAVVVGLLITSVSLAGVSGEGPLAGTLYRDTTRPRVYYGMSIPRLGARTLRIVSIDASEPVRIRLLMTEVGRQSRQNVLLRRSFSTGKGVGVARSLPLRKDVQRGLLIITGIARDRAGNATRLPQCVIDPVSGRASCTFP